MGTCTGNVYGGVEVVWGNEFFEFGSTVDRSKCQTGGDEYAVKREKQKKSKRRTCKAKWT